MPPKKKGKGDEFPRYLGVIPSRGQFKARIYAWDSGMDYSLSMSYSCLQFVPHRLSSTPPPSTCDRWPNPPPHTPPHRPPCVDVYLGHWWAAEKAAHAYDIASIKLRGVNGANRALLLNFPLATYTEQIDQIMPMSFAEFLESVRATADALHPRLKAPGAKTDGGGDKKKGPAKKKK